MTPDVTPEETYVQQVLRHIPRGTIRDQIEAEVRGHIADRIERGGGADAAIRSLGDPKALAESYLAAVPLRLPPHFRRLLAKLVDLVLVFLLPCLVFFTWWTTSAHEPSQPVWIGFATAYLVSLGISCWYPILAEYATGQTLGKRLFGLRVVTEKGTRIGIGQAIVRLLPIFMQIFTIDALFALFTDRRQRAFELLSKTRVVDVREATQPSGTMETATASR
jgi:uncharacterized RDD family membrane protein YckC